MKIMVLHRFDGPDRFVEEVHDRPVPAPTEILVEVAAAGLNPVEWNASRGGWLATLHGGAPLRLGWEVAGRVVEVGYGVTHVKPGDEVFGLPRFPFPAGAYAEYVTGPSRHFAPKPATLSMAEAAALPLAGLTAWQALVDVANVRAGRRVLVTAAAGGVGHLAVQIAKARGAFVAGTARRVNHGFLRDLGVDHPIDYTTDELSTLDPFDIVLDLIGDATLANVVKPAGILISVAGPAAENGVEILVEPDLTGLRALTDLVDQGRLRVHIAKTYPMTSVDEAHAHGRHSHTVGKLALLAR